MRFTNKEIMQIAMKQSAVDANCKVEDFCKKENVVVVSEKHAQARKYLQLPFECNLISYGNNIVASTKEEYREIVGLYINKYPVEHCFETPNMHVLNDEMQKQDLRICFMAEYFLPDVNHLQKRNCDYELRTLKQKDFADLYKKNGEMPFAKREKNWMYWGLLRMTMRN